jgi:hypothetical protein
MPRSSAWFALALPLAACTSSHGVTSDDAAAGEAAPADAGYEATVSCQNDPRVVPFTADVSKTSASGAFKVIILSADPAPPIVGTNTWMVKAQDATGAPVPTPPKVEPFMPDHNHGPSVKARATAQPDGTFQVTPIEFIMTGVWRITFTVPALIDGGAPESVAFFFCVDA